MDNLDDMDKFLETNNLSKLIHEEKNPNKPVTTKEVESVIKHFPIKESSGPDGIIGEICQIFKNYHQSFSNSSIILERRERFLTHSVKSANKARQRHHKKRKLQTNIPYEYWCKMSQRNTGKPNSAAY